LIRPPKKNKTIVIGGDLAAAAYAYLYDGLLIQNHLERPFAFEFFQPSQHIPLTGFKNKSKHLVTADSKNREIGSYKGEMWDHILFQLSIQGQVPFHGEGVKIRLKEGLLHVVVGETKLFKYTYDNLYIFNPTNITGLGPPASEKTASCEVYDWFDVNQGALHPYDLLEDPSPLVREIYFYPSSRIDGNVNNRKDLVSKSVMEVEDLFNIEYSDLYVRFKIQHTMKEHQIFGEKGGPVKLTHRKREVKHNKVSYYNFEDTRVKFLNIKEENILEGECG